MEARKRTPAGYGVIRDSRGHFEQWGNGMRVLCACERSGRVRKAFRDRGHDAWSCDIEPSDDGRCEHIQGDVLGVLGDGWDMMLAFPPCTHLAVSGARHFARKQASGEQTEAFCFFMALANADIPKIVIENPVGIMSTRWRKPDQIIQPWMFGHGETKKTCLWLKGLPQLRPTALVEGREQRIWKMPPSASRATLRSITYQGIANAMAEQWG